MRRAHLTKQIIREALARGLPAFASVAHGPKGYSVVIVLRNADGSNSLHVGASFKAPTVQRAGEEVALRLMDAGFDADSIRQVLTSTWKDEPFDWDRMGLPVNEPALVEKPVVTVSLAEVESVLPGETTLAELRRIRAEVSERGEVFFERAKAVRYRVVP